MKRTLYVFLDEGGNFDFSKKGTAFFSISCISTERPFFVNPVLDAYRYECIEYGIPQEYFHCADDNSHVRKRTFGIIAGHLNSLRIDSLIIEKCKTDPALQEPKNFYSKMLGYLLRYVIGAQDKTYLKEIIIITDVIPINQKRNAVEKSAKQTLADMIPDTEYRILHHASRAHFGLQVADYCNWAILRKWERGDLTHYNEIKPALRSELDIFQKGSTRFY